MIILHNKIGTILKPLVIAIICLISILIFLSNSKHSNIQRNLKNIYKEKSDSFDKIFELRKFEEEENTNSKNYEKICKNSDDDLKEYFLTGNIKKIGEIDNYLIYDKIYKDEPYIESLINFINILVSNGSKEEKNKSLREEFFTYLKYNTKILIFLCFGILALPLWIVFGFCFCCNCCCCCCFKKEACKIPLFIVTLILYTFTFAISIYGIIESNSIFNGIANTECSIHTFLEQILDGETKQNNQNWAGFNNINEIFSELANQIKELRRTKLNDLYQKIDDINNKKMNFKNKMEESGNKLYSSSDSSLYSDLYSNMYSMDSRGISGTYVLDIIKMFGKKVTTHNINEEKYEPKNSTLDLWHNEYKLISTNADTYLEEAINDLNTISDINEDILENIEKGKENLNILIDFFNNVNKEINDILIKSSEAFDKYFKKIMISFFSVLISISIILGVFITLLCLFYATSCQESSFCRCFFKCTINLLWNILCLSMIISFFIGSILLLFGAFGNDMVNAISVIIEKDNNGESGESLINEQLGESKNYLDICISGNGSLIDLLNIKENQINSFNNIKIIEEQIYQTIKEFQDKKSFETYSYYMNQLNARLNLSIIPMLIKDSYEINIPLDDVQYYEAHPEKFLKFDYELELMNSIIRTQGTSYNKNEQWIINSTSSNKCNSGVDPIYYSSGFNPLKCKPLNRDWIQSTSNTNLKTEASIISDILTFLENTIKKDENNEYDPKSLIYILTDLKNEYNEYLDQYISVLDSFDDILNQTIKNFVQYNDNNDDIFSFMNGKVIGTNLKIISKYFKTVLGKESKTFGTVIIIFGFTLILTISSTILLIIIINILSIRNHNYNYNYSNQSIVIPPAPGDTQYRENRTEASFTNRYIKEATDFLIKGCHISREILDARWNCQSGWRTGGKNGPSGYLKDYHPPTGWTAIGLKVAKLYDDEDSSWIGNSHTPGEWYIGYHGVKSEKAIHGICKDGFRREPRQAYINSNNINPLTNKIYPKCGEGVYFTNEINEAATYTGQIEYNNNKYKVVFMCRINPHCVRIANIGNNREYWIVEGDKLGDLFGKKRSDQVRPYRILVKINA